MSQLDYLNYTNCSPYKEVLAVLALEQALNAYQIHERVKKKLPYVSIIEIKNALFELERRGLLMNVNNCFTIAEDWLRNLVLFLNEFEELEESLAKYNAKLQQKFAEEK